MAAPMASTGAQIRNLRRTRCSCTRPRATQAAQRMSNSASATKAGPADAAMTGVTVSALPMYFSQSDEPPKWRPPSTMPPIHGPGCAIEDSMPRGVRYNTDRAMTIDRTEPAERLARIEQLIEEYRAAKQRRLLQRAMRLWRSTAVRQQLAALEASPHRVH